MAQAGKIIDPSDRAEAFAALGWDEDAKTLTLNGAVVSRVISDGESALDGIDPVYQFADVRNPDKSYSISIRSEVPVGNPPEDQGVEATWNVSERISKDQVSQHLAAEWIADAAKLADALDTLEDGDVFYVSYAGTNDNVTYQWTDRDNQNVSYSLQVEESWHEANFSQNERVSKETVSAELGRLATPDDSRYAKLQANIADGKIFFMSQSGNDQPSYQWASETDRNFSYGLSLSVVNEAIQLAVSSTERMSTEFVRQTQAALVKDVSDKKDIDDALALEGVVVYRTLSDGESVLDGDDASPTYTFADPTNADRNYALAVNAYAPDGPEATINITTRISKTQVRQHIESDAGGEWIQDPLKKAQAVTALADGDMFYMSQGGTDDTPQYQWSSMANSDLGYSMQIKDSWHQSIFSRSERVLMAELLLIYNAATEQGALVDAYNARKAEIEADRDALPAGDSRIADLNAALTLLETDYTTQKDLLAQAIVDGEMVSRIQAGDDDPSYQLSSKTDHNKNYSLTVNLHAPVGEPDANGNYTVFRTEFAITLNQRVSINEIDKESVSYNYIKDPAQLAAIDQALTPDETAGIMVYKAVTNGEDPVYQWSSPTNTDVSYSIAFDTHVPTGIGATAGYTTIANFTKTERVGRATMLGLLPSIGTEADDTERQNAESAIADGDSFSVSTRGNEDLNYAWSSFSNPGVSYSITMDVHAVRDMKGTFKKTTRVSQEDLETITEVTAPVTVSQGVADDRFGVDASGQAIPVRDLLLGDLLNDSNWDEATVQLVEGVGADGALDWTGYSITSEDGSITRMVILSLEVNADGKYVDLDPTTPDTIDRIQYIETTKVAADTLIAGGRTAQELFGGYVDAGAWPVSHVTVSFNSFAEAGRVLAEDFYDLASYDSNKIRIATLTETTVGPVQVEFITQVDQAEVLKSVNLIRDEAMQQAANLAASDPLAVYYKIEGDGKQISYQWTSSQDPNVSYTISVDLQVSVANLPLALELADAITSNSTVTFEALKNAETLEVFKTLVAGSNLSSELQDAVAQLIEAGWQKVKADLNDPDLKKKESFTQEAVFTTTTRVSRETIVQSYNNQIARTLVSLIDTSSDVTLSGLLNANFTDFKTMVANSQTLASDLKEVIGELTEDDWNVVKEGMSDPGIITNALVSVILSSSDPGVTLEQLRSAPDLTAFKNLVASSLLSDDMKAYVATLDEEDWEKVAAEVDSPEGISAISSEELKMLMQAVQESTNLAITFNRTDTVDGSREVLTQYTWTSIDGIKSYALGFTNTAVVSDIVGDEEVVEYERTASFSMSQNFAKIEKEFLVQLCLVPYIVTSIGDSGNPGVTVSQLQGAATLAGFQALIASSNLGQDIKDAVAALIEADWSKTQSSLQNPKLVTSLGSVANKKLAEALNDIDDYTLFTMTLTGEGYSYSWESLDGNLTYTLSQSTDWIATGSDESGTDTYDADETWTFKSEKNISQSAVSGYESVLTPDKRRQYSEALANVTSATDFSMTKTGRDVNYSWVSANKAKVYTLTKTFAKVESLEGQDVVGKWDFNVQMNVRRSMVEKAAANLPEGLEKTQYLAALRDSASWTKFTMTISGNDINYKWTGRNGTKTYSLTNNPIWTEYSDADGNMTYQKDDKWNFSVMDRVAKTYVNQWINDIGDPLQRDQCWKALQDTDMSSVYTRTQSGDITTYRWTGRDDATSYILSQSKRYTLKVAVDAGGNVIKDEQGNVTYEKDGDGNYLYDMTFEWYFRSEVLVTGDAVTGYAAKLENDVLRNQYIQALADVTEATFFTKSTAGDEDSYSWTSYDEENTAQKATYTLSMTREKFFKEDGTLSTDDIERWSFRSEHSVDVSVIRYLMKYLDDDMKENLQDVLDELAEKDLEKSIVFTKATNGLEDSYTWQSFDRVKSYNLSASRIDASVEGSRWSFTEQVTVPKLAVEGYTDLLEVEYQAQYGQALLDVCAADDASCTPTVYTMTRSGDDVSFGWKSKDESKTYSLARTTEKALKTDGVPPTYNERQKWSFSTSIRVTKDEADNYVNLLGSNAVQQQYLDALDLLEDDATDNVDDATVYTKTLSGESQSYSWQALDGLTTHRLALSKNLVYQPELDTQGNVILVDGEVQYQKDPVTDELVYETQLKWNFSSERLVLRSEVLSEDNKMRLETTELREQYQAVLDETPLTVAFSRTTSGTDVSYSWHSKDKIRNFTFGKTMVEVETGKDSSGEPVFGLEVGSWSFSEQVAVLKSVVEANIAKLWDSDQITQITAALADTDEFTVYTRTTSGMSVSYDWQSVDKARNYSLSSEKIKDPDGALVDVKWTFSTKFLVQKIEVMNHAEEMDAEYREQYENALDDTNDATVYSKTVSGGDVAYSWKSVVGGTYSLNRTMEKVYVPDTNADGSIKLDDQGEVIYKVKAGTSDLEYAEARRWTFSRQNLVLRTEAAAYEDKLETLEAKSQYNLALADTDLATVFTRVTSGNSISYSWKSVSGSKNYNLANENVKVLATETIDPDTKKVTSRTFTDNEKWSFSEQVYVLKAAVEGHENRLESAELQAQYGLALDDIALGTYFTRVTSGADISYSWKSADGIKTYTLSEERVIETPATETTPPVFNEANAKWSFSGQFRVQRIEVADHVNDLEEEYQAQYEAALPPPDTGIVYTKYTKTISGASFTYSWEATDEGSIYSLSRSTEKIYVPEVETVDGVERIKTVDGQVVYQTDPADPTKFLTEPIRKWSFSEQVFVPQTVVQDHVADLETYLARAQATEALANAVTGFAAFTRTVSGTNVNFSWKSLTGGKTYGLSSDIVKIMTSETLVAFEDNIKWSFSEQSLALRSEVEGNSSNLLADQQQQYSDALANTNDSTYFTKTMSGSDLSYSWKAKDGIKSYTLSVDRVVTTPASETPATETTPATYVPGVYSETNAKWTLSEQIRVKKVEIEEQIKDFEDPTVAEQYAAALRSPETNELTIYTKTISGGDVSYSWRNPDGTATYSLGRVVQKISDADGNLAETQYKWNFSKQVYVTKTLAAAYADKLEIDAVREQYTTALADTTGVTEYTMSLSGTNKSYSWKSKDGAKTYSLSRTDVLTQQADGTWQTRSKWNFSEQVLVLRSEVDQHGGDLEADDVRTQYTTALNGDHTDASTVYTRMTSGNEDSYTWKDKNGITTYNLSKLLTETTGAVKWSFSASALVQYAELLNHQTDLASQEERDDYNDAVADHDSWTEFTRTTNGGDVTYSWKSVDKQRTYALSKSIVRELQLNGDYLDQSKWNFSTQTVVNKEVFTGANPFLGTALQLQYAAALIDTSDVTEFSMSTSGKTVSYAWKSKNGDKSYSLAKSLARTLVSQVTNEEGVVTETYETRDKWDFSEQITVLISEAESYKALLPEDQISQCEAAIPAGVKTASRSTSGSDVSYGWKSGDGRHTYSLSKNMVQELQAVLQPDGTYYVSREKFNFATQTAVAKALVAGHVDDLAMADTDNLSSQQLREQYNASLADTNDFTQYTLSVSGTDESYNWRAVDESKTYLLSKSIVQELQANGEYSAKPKWSFSIQQVLDKVLVDGHVNDLAAADTANPNSQELRKQYTDSLAEGAYDAYAGFTASTSGTDVSYSWKSADWKKSYSLNKSETAVLQADGTSTVWTPKWSFSIQQAVSLEYVNAFVASLPANSTQETDQLRQAQEALGTTNGVSNYDSHAGFTMSMNGTDVSYSWKSADGKKSYSLNKSETAVLQA
ncbi:MAG: hypothetical protein WC331_07115, partial [Candidatus Omnitrophota bacterium]